MHWTTQDAQGNPELDKQAFLKLMMTQMANQDPTAPKTVKKMAAQLAQFFHLGGHAINQRSPGTHLLKQAVGNQTSMANLIGKDIKINTSEMDHKEGNVENINLTLKLVLLKRSQLLSRMKVA